MLRLRAQPDPAILNLQTRDDIGPATPEQLTGGILSGKSMHKSPSGSVRAFGIPSEATAFGLSGDLEAAAAAKAAGDSPKKSLLQRFCWEQGCISLMKGARRGPSGNSSSLFEKMQWEGLQMARCW